MSHTPRHLIFDVDGTLFDTEFEVSRLTADIAVEKGCVVSAETVFQDFAGLGSRAKFNAIAAAHGATFSEA